MKKRGVWTNRKYFKRAYKGSYAWGFLSDPSKERVFVLRGLMKSGQEHVCVFESHESAKRNGWLKR